MSIFIGLVVLLVLYIVIKNIALTNKAKKILESVSVLAVDICKEQGVPVEFSQNALKTDYEGLLYHCKGAAKAMATAPDLSDRGVSAKALEILSLQELAKEIAQGILNEYNEGKA